MARRALGLVPRRRPRHVRVTAPVREVRLVRRLTSRIYGQVKEQYQPPEGEDKDEMLAMNQETWRRYPPDQNWLSDLIQTLLVDEMFRRRSRRRNSRQWS